MTLFSVHFQKSCHHCESMYAIFRCSYPIMRPSSGSFYSNEDAMKIYLHAAIVFWVWVETNVLKMMKAWLNLEDVFKCIIQKHRNIKELCMKIQLWIENNSAFNFRSLFIYMISIAYSKMMSHIFINYRYVIELYIRICSSSIICWGQCSSILFPIFFLAYISREIDCKIPHRMHSSLKGFTI